LCVCVLQQEIKVLEARRDVLKGRANLSAIAEYRKKEAEYRARQADLEAVNEERDVARCVEREECGQQDSREWCTRVLLTAPLTVCRRCLSACRKRFELLRKRRLDVFMKGFR
jgi:hypothetical protein